MMKELVDLRYLEWAKKRESSGTAGSYLKSMSYSNGKKVYYKLSFFDEENHMFGYESVNEYIASLILDELGYDHLNYKLIHGLIKINDLIYDTYLSSSIDFKKSNEEKITLENYYKINKEDNDDIISFCKVNGFIKEIYQMIIFDYLICNRDRHGANIEVLFQVNTNCFHLAPLFDHGLSLLSPNYKKKDIEEYDIKKEVRVNSFVGSSSLYDNLQLVPKKYFPVNKPDFKKIIGNIDIEDKFYLDKVVEMLEWRWKKLEDFRDQKQE